MSYYWTSKNGRAIARFDDMGDAKAVLDAPHGTSFEVSGAGPPSIVEVEAGHQLRDDHGTILASKPALYGFPEREELAAHNSAIRRRELCEAETKD